jgi:monovalent cation/proton antiporter MnhG/PhaG subunit
LVLTTSSLFTWILLIAGMASFLLTTLGMLLVRDVYQRIQYAYPAATVGFVAVVAAILIHKSISQAGIKTLLTGLIVFWTNPVISHATARAARVRKLGHWLPGDKENIQAAGDDE